MNLSNEEIKNLSTLFLSKDDSNTELAFEIMDNHEFSKELLTEIFVVFKLTKTSKLKEKAKVLLTKHGSTDIQYAMNRKIEFNTEKAIKGNISKYVGFSNNELDGLKFARALYNKYNLGFAYLMKEGDSNEIKNILKEHIQGKTFSLHNKGLTAMPKEFFEFTELEEINLRGNNLANINVKFKVFQNLKKLDISRNCLKKVHICLGTLTQLEDLDLSHNLMEDFPEAIGNITNLKKLDISDMLNHNSNYNKVTVPDNFFKLKLNYLGLDNDTINGNRHGFSTIPFFEKITAPKNETISLIPLNLAKQAFEQGDKSPVYYLLFHAESEYITKVLTHFYDSDTKTMNLSNMSIKYLPKELSQFDIKILDMNDCDFGYNYSLVDSTDEGFKVIGDLKNLEELDLKSNGLDDIPTPIFNCKKLRILNVNNNNINSIPSIIEKLSELKEIFLDGHSWDAIEFPDEIKKLTKLEKVKINSLSHKEDEYKNKYINRLEELFDENICSELKYMKTTSWTKLN